MPTPCLPKHGDPVELYCSNGIAISRSNLGLHGADKLGIQFGYVAILVSAVTVNMIRGYGFSLAAKKYSRRKLSWLLM
jgi:hypothetical protein